MEMYFKRMKDEWTGLVEQADPPIRAKAAEIAVAHAHYLSIEFYRIVRIDPHAEEFLSNEQVERQLKSAMERWIINVLSAQVDDVERLIQIQHTVAEVHARIGIPVEIVEMGFRVLKKILYPVIFSSDYSAAEKLQVYHFSINSIDIAMEVMTRAFTFSDSSASKEDENYRIFSLLENAEEEKERQIASILSWEIDIIYKVLLDSDLGSSLPLSQADFGLWFNHKGRHYFSGIAEVGHISRLIQDFDGIFNQTMRNTRNLNNRSLRVKFLLQIRNTVSQIITLLRELFEEVRLDYWLDPPTHVTGFYLLDALLEGNGEVFFNALQHLILPALTLAFVHLGIVARQIRSAMLEQLSEDYIRIARASGLPGWYIVLCYALPNALIPSITVLGLALGDLLYGAVLTETVFAWPGMGAWVVTSIQALDFPAVMGFAVVVSFAYVLVNLVVDLLYLWIDPRIGRGGGE